MSEKVMEWTSKADTVRIMRDYIQQRIDAAGLEQVGKDFGVFGKAFEIAIRCYVGNKLSAEGMTVKAQGKVDMYARFQGKSFPFEIKTACGNISTVKPYIIYCPNVDITFPAELQGYVFTRQQWADFINGYNGRGSFLRKGSDGLHIQSFYVSETIRPKASKVIARYIESVLFEMPTVQEFFARRKG